MISDEFPAYMFFKKAHARHLLKVTTGENDF